VNVYLFIEAEKVRQRGNVRRVCSLLKVSRAAYYAWSASGPDEPRRRDDELLAAIKEAHKASRGTYGSPRITRELRGLDPFRQTSKIGRARCPERMSKHAERRAGRWNSSLSVAWERSTWPSRSGLLGLTQTCRVPWSSTCRWDFVRNSWPRSVRTIAMRKGEALDDAVDEVNRVGLRVLLMDLGSGAETPRRPGRGGPGPASGGACAAPERLWQLVGRRPLPFLASTLQAPWVEMPTLWSRPGRPAIPVGLKW